MNFKKLLFIIIGIALIVFGVIVVCFKLQDNADGYRFKTDFEQYNKLLDDEGNMYESLEIDGKNNIIYLTEDNALKEFTTGNKLIFVGSAADNSTRKAVPFLLNASSDNGDIDVYYYDAQLMKKNKSDYNKIIKLIGSKSNTFYPALVLIKEGKVYEKHIGTSNLSSSYEDLFVGLIMCQENC
ncbi:MAG: hypothetical protein Q4C29_02370 [bacterium]|nr:hypothetical protein [bacterium]